MSGEEIDVKRFAKAFKALGNPNRFRLFAEILQAHESNYERGHDCFLASIMQSLKIARPTISHHLKELVNAGLITTELQGKFLTCTVNEAALAELEGFFARARLRPQTPAAAGKEPLRSEA